MERDSENITYIHSVETLYSGGGLRFQREKYLPKIEFIKKHFGASAGEKKLLHVGIGYGVFLHLIEKEHGFRNLYGMDPYEGSIEIAGKFTSAVLRRGDIMDEEWPFEKGFFDIITCFDVVEHLEEPGVFFRKAALYLAEGGIVVVTTPNKSLPYRMRSIPLIGFPDRNPTHINVQPPSFWLKMASATGYEVVSSWKGEHLTHIRFIPKVLTLIFRLIGADHRKVPVVNSFEQSFCMVLKRSSTPGA